MNAKRHAASLLLGVTPRRVRGHHGYPDAGGIVAADPEPEAELDHTAEPEPEPEPHHTAEPDRSADRHLGGVGHRDRRGQLAHLRGHG